MGFKGDEESREERWLDGIVSGRRRHRSHWGAAWNWQVGKEREGWGGVGGGVRPTTGLRAGLLGFRRKSQGRCSRPRDCKGKLEEALNFPSNLCLSWRTPNRVAEAAWGSGRILLCFSNYPVTQQKIILSWEEGRFGVLQTCCGGGTGGLIGIHKSAF